MGIYRDAAGHITNDGAHTYTYDAENRIVAVDTSGATATYQYDAFGHRIATTVGSTPHELLYDASGKMFASMLVTPTRMWERGELYAGNWHLATYSWSTTFFNHADWLGTVRVKTDPSGAQTNESFTSLPFGDALSSIGASASHFTDQDRDAESGLDHFLFRQYSSIQGRWMSPDPAGMAAVNPMNPQSWNRYAYVLNNPINAIDPLGLDCVYLTDGGNGVESVDQFSDWGECSQNGGYWVDGGVTNVSYGDNGSVTLTGTTGSSQTGAYYSPTGSLYLTPSQSFWSGWDSNFSFLYDFVTGNTPHTRTYGPGQIQTASLLNSKVVNQMMENVLENCDSVSSGSSSISTPKAAENAFTFRGGAPDVLASPTAFQLGAFDYDWLINGSKVNFVVRNSATQNSFFFHIPEKVGIDNPTSGPFGTINQTFNFSLGLPFYAQCSE